MDETRKGFNCIKAGKPVLARRFAQGPKHELHLGELTGLAQPNLAAERQLQKHLARAAERAAEEGCQSKN